MKKYLVSTLCAVLWIGCGGGSSSGSKAKFTYNSEGYPLVDGEYTVKLKPYTLTCNNGKKTRKIKKDGETIEWQITSKGNRLYIEGNTWDNKTIAIVNEKDSGVYLQKDATFSRQTTKDGYGYLAGNRINVTGVTVTSGVFTPNGLKGKRVFEGVEDYGSFIATCSGVQEFSGTKAYPI